MDKVYKSRRKKRGMNIAYNLLVYFVWFLSTYYTIVVMLSLFLKRKEIFEQHPPLKQHPLVSIIVPAFNEEASIAGTIQSLRELNYPNYEVIILNDGSKDKTSQIVKSKLKGLSNFRFIDNKKNKGKAACLNQGIAVAKGEFFGCMDADSIVEPDIIKKTIPYFRNSKVGAVTVSVETYKPKGILQRVIDLEYVLGLSLFLKIFSFHNAVFVTPGPFTMFRSSVANEIGGFDKESITEDFEIAFRIHKAGYKIRNCIEAKVHTIIPPTFKGIYVQRKRWYTGSLQTIFQHKNMLFRKKYGVFAFLIPFNYSLIVFGLVLFLYASYLGFSKLFENLLHFRYTDYNLFQRLFDWHFDILNYGQVNMLSMTVFLGGILLMIFGLKAAKKSFAKKRFGMLGYPFLFILYQVFWLGSIIAFLRGRKVKWR